MLLFSFWVVISDQLSWIGEHILLDGRDLGDLISSASSRTHMKFHNDLVTQNSELFT